MRLRPEADDECVTHGAFCDLGSPKICPPEAPQLVFKLVLKWFSESTSMPTGTRALTRRLLIKQLSLDIKSTSYHDAD